MGIFDTVAMPYKVQGTVYIEPLAKRREIVFDAVRPFDILEIPLDARGVTDIKAYGARRRLGPKRCRVDAESRLVQVMSPPPQVPAPSGLSGLSTRACGRLARPTSP